MLTPIEVAPFLLHEKTYVRDHALEYLADAHDVSPITADALWPVIDRYGNDGGWRAWNSLSKLPQTESSLRRAIAALAGDLDEEIQGCLESVIEQIDLSLLSVLRDELLQLDQLPKEVRDHLRLRLELADEPVDRLWEKLLAHAEEVKERYVGDFDKRISQRLIEAVGRYEQAGSRACELLSKTEGGSWNEIFLVQVVGAARWEPAVELLLHQLEKDGDVLSEEAVNALVRIGTADTVRKMEAFYPGKEWSVRLYLHDPFGRIKRIESEEALLRLMDQEKEQDLRHDLAGSLCRLCPTPERLAMLRDRLVAGKLQGDMFDLDREIMAAGVMVGYAPPESRSWERRIEREDRRLAALTREAKELELLVEEKRNALNLLESGDDGWMEPIERGAPKIGRNDPCPCGSGKKYKKCCLGKGDTSIGVFEK